VLVIFHSSRSVQLDILSLIGSETDKGFMSNPFQVMRIPEISFFFYVNVFRNIAVVLVQAVSRFSPFVVRLPTTDGIVLPSHIVLSAFLAGSGSRPSLFAGLEVRECSS